MKFKVENKKKRRLVCLGSFFALIIGWTTLYLGLLLADATPRLEKEPYQIDMLILLAAIGWGLLTILLVLFYPVEEKYTFLEMENGLKISDAFENSRFIEYPILLIVEKDTLTLSDMHECVVIKFPKNKQLQHYLEGQAEYIYSLKEKRFYD